MIADYYCNFNECYIIYSVLIMDSHVVTCSHKYTYNNILNIL